MSEALTLSPMARPADRNPLTVQGDWYVDTGCIGCDAARQVAPGLIAADDKGLSIFLRQPESSEDLDMAWRAQLVCPTRSVGNEEVARPYPKMYPHDLGDGVFRLGHNSRSSFGAHSYLVQRPLGNLMIDAPRWTREVYKPLEEMGGVSDILLTHRDDIADADRYAERFDSKVWIHADDSDAVPYATDQIQGLDPLALRSDVIAYPVPGHTEGSVLFEVDGHLLFSGDSLAWQHTQDELTAFRGACWYSWDAQIDSLRRFAEHNAASSRAGTGFDRLFCGHGWSHDAQAVWFQEALDRLFVWMDTVR